MARIRDFDRTRSLLIKAASQLFAADGYDRISVDRIIREAGVSKGAFYHHFATKEEILDAVTASLVSTVMEEIEHAIGDRSVSALVRLNRFFETSRVWKLAHLGLLKEVLMALYRDENATMLRKIQTNSVNVCAPPLADILEQGIDEGVFDLPYPQDAARLIMQLGLGMQVDVVQVLTESEMTDAVLTTLERRISLLVEMVERMLGAPKGSIVRPQIAQAFRLQNLEPAGAAPSATVDAS
jgi:AcrR family transcriptional regulator